MTPTFLEYECPYPSHMTTGIPYSSNGRNKECPCKTHKASIVFFKVSIFSTNVKMLDLFSFSLANPWYCYKKRYRTVVFFEQHIQSGKTEEIAHLKKNLGK